MDPPNPDQGYGLLSLPVIYKDREILFVILQTRDIYLISYWVLAVRTNRKVTS